ncbi:MAG: hypothetical protein PHO15_09630, partial [Eubacteriales bacterium]|nr:hypothetical protein [Eubacteriales bacterium]
LKTNQCIATLHGHTNKIAQVTIRHPELISLDIKGTVKIWSLLDYTCTQTHDTNICEALKMEVNNDTLIVVVKKSELYKSIIVLSMKSWEQMKSWDEFTGNLRDMKISGNKLFATTQNGVCAFSLDDFQKNENWVGHDSWVESLDICGDLLATASGDHTVKLWNIDTGECIKTFSGHSNSVKKVFFYDNHLVSCADEIKIWAPANTAAETAVMQHKGSVNALIFHGPHLFSGSQDGTVKQWDTKTYSNIETFYRSDGVKAWVESLDCSEDTLFAGYTGDRGRFETLQSWPLKSSETLVPFTDCKNDVNALALFGDKIITAHNFRKGIGLSSLAVHSLLTGKKTATLEGIDGTIADIKHQNGKIYSAGGEGVLGVWSAITYESIYRSEPLGCGISSIGLGNDRLYAACGFNFNKIGVLRSGETEWQYTQPARMNVSRITVSGDYIIGFNRENDLLTIWLSDSGEVLCDMNVDEYIGACAVSDNKIFCGTLNGNIHVMIPENFVCNEDFIPKKEISENAEKNE